MPKVRLRPRSSLSAPGECQFHKKDFTKAAEILAPFRDQAPLQNVAGISDRAMLRLGHALALAGQWEPSKQANEVLLQRFGQSRLRSEARYGVGFALQNQKQFDQAANAYSQVIAETAMEVAAKSQYQLALCRLGTKAASCKRRMRCSSYHLRTITPNGAPCPCWKRRAFSKT